MDTDLDGDTVILASRQTLWLRGDLRYLLHSEQLAIYNQIKQAETAGHKRFVLEISRQFGKSWLLTVLACEACLNKPGSRVVYGAPSLKHLTEFVLPTIAAVTQDAPASCKPVYNTQTGHLRFPNGSWIHLFGADDVLKASRGRGPKAVLCLMDEAAFSPVLEYVIDNVFKATTLHSGGMVILSSTPADTPGHPFTLIAERAEDANTYAHRTIFQNPLLTSQRIEAFIAEGANEQGLTVEKYQCTDVFRREYLAERVVDKKLVVVPEWEAKKSSLIRAVERPKFFNGMTVMDPGGHDPTGIVFCYWHFQLATLVVEREILLRGNENSADIAERIRQTESELWGVNQFNGTMRAAVEDEAVRKLMPEWMHEALLKQVSPQPYARWMDINEILARDMYSLHGLAFIPTAKDDKEAAVNDLRVLIRSDKLVINPQCVNLIRHLRTTTWKDHKRREYARRGGEHGDLLDALVYASRNVDRQRNPEPEPWRQPSPIEVLKQKEQRNKLAEALMGNSALARRLRQ